MILSPNNNIFWIETLHNLFSASLYSHYHAAIPHLPQKLLQHLLRHPRFRVYGLAKRRSPSSGSIDASLLPPRLQSLFLNLPPRSTLSFDIINTSSRGCQIEPAPHPSFSDAFSLFLRSDPFGSTSLVHCSFPAA
jgi:hypothetical protein